jgi:hypothetical protein
MARSANGQASALDGTAGKVAAPILVLREALKYP